MRGERRAALEVVLADEPERDGRLRVGRAAVDN